MTPPIATAGPSTDADPAAANLLEAVTLVKTYRSARALSGVSLRLEPGVTGLLGPNGAGKSTLMRILATVARPTTGKLRWNDADLLENPNALRRRLGYLPQDFGVYPQLSADEFLSYMATLKGIPNKTARRQIDVLIDSLNLGGVRRRLVGGFSGGMRQRVGIAQALLGDPAVIIVDEPTAGLDPQERVRFRELLRSLARERIILLSTHIVSDLETIADRIAILVRGHIVAQGSRAATIGAHASLEAAYLHAVEGVSAVEGVPAR
jgi:ABC-type multidrug transport system ATPase subunit